MDSVTHTYYLVYKITNKTNGKFYIGCHKTKLLSDKYMGSGKLIKQAILKYGIENFQKEILYTFQDSAKMFATEKILITRLKPEYNLHEGGLGGWDYINENKINTKNLSLSEAGKKGNLMSQKVHQENYKKRLISYQLNPKRCKQCNSAIPRVKRFNTFCNSSCSATYNNTH